MAHVSINTVRRSACILKIFYAMGGVFCRVILTEPLQQFTRVSHSSVTTLDSCFVHNIIAAAVSLRRCTGAFRVAAACDRDVRCSGRGAIQHRRTGFTGTSRGCSNTIASAFIVFLPLVQQPVQQLYLVPRWMAVAQWSKGGMMVAG